MMGYVDVAVASILIVRKLGFLRTVAFAPILMPLMLWALPPTSCSCFGNMFRRCNELSGRGKAFQGAMKSDLRQLESQQEMYYAEAWEFAVDLDQLSYVTSDGVVITITATDRSWAAVAHHEAFETRSCSIWAGAAIPPGFERQPGQMPGDIVCIP